MLRRLKINTAFFICTAFILRLLFVNVSAFASINSNHSNEFLKQHFSSHLKKRRKPTNNVNTRTDSKEFTMQDVYQEETENEDDFDFTKAPAFFSVFFSFFKVFDAPLSGTPFDHIKYHLSPRKYLSLSVLRI